MLLKVDTRSAEVDRESERGKIEMTIGYDPTAGAFMVHLIRCAELAGMDASGYSDPYVRLKLTPATNKKHKHKTIVKKRTCNPEYNEVFAFPIALRDLKDRALEVVMPKVICA